jgi:hypothetical protein
MRAVTTIARSIGPVVLGVALGLAAIVPIASASGLSDQARICGAQGNIIQAEFDLPTAKSIWTRFPALGLTPELASDSRPAHVVVFKGAFDPSDLRFGRAGAPDRLERVVCVIQADGVVNLYTDVSRTGSGYAD